MDMAKTLLLGSGLLVLAFSLILLQLKFYREGDIKKSKNADKHNPSNVPSAPRELKSPRLRTIWKNMEETRSLMKLKEEKAYEEERKREQTFLGLPAEEEILFMGDRSLFFLWPVILVSLIFVTVSTMVAPTPSLLCLGIGLLGLLCLARANRSTRYYITNFRILVRTRSLLRMKPRWTALHYHDIRRCSVEKTLVQQNLKLEGQKGTVDIKGLSRDQFETASRILTHIIHPTSA